MSNPQTPAEPIKSASEYARRVQEKRAQTSALKGKGAPLGGAEPIPAGKLAALTMPKPTFGPDENPPPINAQEAAQFQGVGAAYPVNQAMAKGELSKPVSLREAKESGGLKVNSGRKDSSLSPETVEALEKAKEYSDSPQAKEDAAVLDEEQELDKAEKAISDSSTPIDFAALIGARNELFTEDRRKKIEERLQPLNLADMITHREIKQLIPIIPGRFELMLRTFNQIENLFCLRYLSEYVGSAAYQEELLNTFKLVCATVAINGALLPEHRDNVGQKNEEVNKEKFKEKLQALMTFPVQLVADISVQNIWFQRRVEKLFSLENLKNG
jgi:hypothetical protein